MRLHHLITIEEFISESALYEVGEASVDPVPWELTYDRRDEAVYTFYEGSDIYQVHIGKKSINEITFYFDCNGDRDNSTNKGNQFKIMSTVISILKDYLDKNIDVNKFSFVPSIEYDYDERRFNFYKSYIKKKFPNSKMTVEDLPRGYKSVEVNIR